MKILNQLIWLGSRRSGRPSALILFPLKSLFDVIEFLFFFLQLRIPAEFHCCSSMNQLFLYWVCEITSIRITTDKWRCSGTNQQFKRLNNSLEAIDWSDCKMLFPTKLSSVPVQRWVCSVYNMRVITIKKKKKKTKKKKKIIHNVIDYDS